MAGFGGGGSPKPLAPCRASIRQNLWSVDIHETKHGVPVGGREEDGVEGQGLDDPVLRDLHVCSLDP